MRGMVLVQHCQSHHHVNPDARLWPDSRNGLTELGMQQARETASRLKSAFEGSRCSIYSSDMRRARDTALEVGRQLGTEPITVPEFREWNGRFAVERDQDGEEWIIGDSDCPLFDWRPFPEAESWREFYTRVCKGLEAIESELTEGSVPILVVHGGTISNIIIWWLGLPLDILGERAPFTGSPGGISVLRENKHSNNVLVGFNDLSHLQLSATDGVLKL